MKFAVLRGRPLCCQRPTVKAIIEILHGNVLGQETSETQRRTGETQEIHEYIRFRCDMTEIMLKSA